MKPSARPVLAGVLALAVVLTACGGDEDEQIAELERQVADLESELEQTEASLETARDVNDELQDELAATQEDLAATQEDLDSTQASLEETQGDLAATQDALLDAQAELAAVGELVLDDGTYVGPVLGAKATPVRVIVFNAGGDFRAAEVADDATITAGGDDFTLSQFAKLLASTDPDDVNLAQGNYKVIVKKSLVTSIRKSSA